MSLTQIDDNFTFVGSKREWLELFGARHGRDVNIGDDATILLVPDNATVEDRIEMAEKAAKITNKN